MFQEIWLGIGEEFSDLPDAKVITHLAVRLFLGAFLGGLIGLQREWNGKAAGTRTHMLVCIGTAFFIAIPQQSGMSSSDLSRIIQGLTAGIGFLGAGSILKLENSGKIEGLTTAATIWFTAAIGISIGLGREASAVLATVLGLATLSLVHTEKLTSTFAPQLNKPFKKKV